MSSSLSRRTAAAVAMALGCCTTVHADILARAVLVTPLAPDQNSRLSLNLPPPFSPEQETWVAYELVALSADTGNTGEVGLEQSFEGVKTPLGAFYATFKAADMESRKSAGTIAQRLEEISGHRHPEDLKRMMGSELFAVYEAVNEGKGRVLGGRLLRRLPAPGTSDARLQISVERAEGMQPLALKVTVGQGELPPELQDRTKDVIANRIGYGLGLALFGWLVMRFFRRRGE